METFINEFYDNPKNITNKEETIEIINNYKKQLLENKYLLYIADNEITNKLFIMFLFYYDMLVNEIDNNNKIHCGIDFEFNNNKIALMQINFVIENFRYIWIIDPTYYIGDKLDIINDKIFLNDRIYKVLHGSESLDIPYIYKYLLNNEKNKILKFTNKLIDTRFLCEYVRISLLVNGKCSIYDAMLYFGTINKNTYDELETNNKNMGPIYKIKWEINNLDDKIILYTINDVLNLNNLVNDIFKRILDVTPTYVRTYYYIMKIIRFVILERQHICDIINFIKNKVNKLNNNVSKFKDEQMTYDNIYHKIIDNCIINDDDDIIYISFIGYVDYIKKYYNYLLKYIVYCNFDNNLIVGDLYDVLKENGLDKIIDLLKLFDNHIKKLK